MFKAALFTKKYKQHKCLSTYELVKTICYIHTMHYYLVIRNEVLVHAAMWINL